MDTPTAMQRLKSLVVFQLKLGLDALRDFALSPISVLCALLDMLVRSPKGHGYFDKLLNVGRQSDHWINLFEHHDTPSTEPSGGKVDDWIDEFERRVKQQVKQGKLSPEEASKLEAIVAGDTKTNSSDDAPQSTN